ncbi:hypothetical protein HS327_00174 [Glaesserella parasuis]|nr:hypothetical protein HS327_00174 [Glaesserella parasuis]
MYYNGKGISQDYHQAFKWFQKAAEKGDAKAQAALGVLYLSGQGVRQNNATGKIWFRKACDNGYQYACDLYRQSNKGK